MLRVIVLLALAVASSREAYAEAPVCPAEHEFARQTVEKMLNSPGLSRERTETGVSGLGTAQLRLLTDLRDAAACQRLNSLLGVSGRYPQWRWTAYQAGSFYFVAYRRVTPAGELPHFLPLMILDQNFNRVNVFAL
jgi:hypothetical protein